MCKTFYVLFVGLFLNDVTSYNPILTYTLRFKKITLTPNITGNLVIDQYRNTQYVNGNVTIYSKEYIDTVVAVFYRCNLEGNECEYFQTWKLTDICPKLKDKNQLWSRWYDSFHPPVHCPINKVHYQIKNGTIDIGTAMILYPDAVDYQWKVTQKFYAGNIYIGSFTAEAYMFGYRKRNPKRN